MATRTKEYEVKKAELQETIKRLEEKRDEGDTENYKYNSHRIDPKYYSNFMAMVKPDEKGCWIWQGWSFKSGYGQFKERFNFRAHRWAYEYFKGEIPGNKVIDHLCRVRNCVNPDHLEAVSQRENSLRGVQPNMQSAVLGLCKKGHQLSMRKRSKDSGFRWCPTCDTERAKKYREIRKLEKRSLETI